MREILGNHVELSPGDCFLFQIVQARWRCEVSRKRHILSRGVEAGRALEIGLEVNR